MIKNGTIQKRGYSFLFAFHSDYSMALSRIISETKQKITPTLVDPVRGPRRSIAKLLAVKKLE